MKIKHSNANVPVKHLARISFDQINENSKNFFPKNGAFAQGLALADLVEEISTGYWFVMPPNDEAVYHMYGWSGEFDNPDDVHVMQDTYVWDMVDIDAHGTRVGGVKNFGLDKWPHFEGKPLPFTAQYLTDEGKYIYVFVDQRRPSQNAENQANCALVEGGPVPSWIELSSLNVSPSNGARNPLYAFKPKTPSQMRPTPINLEKSDYPEGYDFLIQFGHSMIQFMNVPSENVNQNTLNQFAFPYRGDMYLFHNPETLEARVLWQ